MTKKRRLLSMICCWTERGRWSQTSLGRMGAVEQKGRARARRAAGRLTRSRKSNWWQATKLAAAMR